MYTTKHPVFDHLGPFWAHLDPFGPFQTKMNFLPQMGVAEVLRSKKSIFVWNGPKWSRWARKGPKWSKTLRLTILDPFGPLWNVDKPAMFGHFWSKMDHFWRLPAMDLWLNGPKMAWILDLTWVKYIQVEWAPLLSITVSLAEKSLIKWPEMAKTMAIFCHK